MQQDLTPSALASRINDALGASFRSPVWVRATLASHRVNKGGYENWVINDGTPSPVRLDVSLTPARRAQLQAQLAAANLTLQENLPLRILLRPALTRFGKLACELLEFDVDYSRDLTGLTPQQVFENLTREGIAAQQSSVPLVEFPLRIVLVGAEHSDGVRDALAVLEESGIAFRIGLIDVPVQGHHAPGAIRAALARTAALSHPADAVLLVRGGGDRADLAAFDDPALARDICNLPLPVLCGIGHEADTTVCDLVAHHSARTPTGIAQWLVERVRAGLAQRLAAHDAALSRALERLDAALLAIERRSAAIDSSITALDSLAASLDLCLERASALALSALDAADASLARSLDTALARAETTVAAREAALNVALATLTELHPTRALERGYAIVRHEGRALRSITVQRPAGIEIQLADGTLDATIP